MLEYIQKWTHYTWFFYLGIFFFVTHYYLNQSTHFIDMSYFGLLLIFIGIKKPGLYGWFVTMLWVFIVVNILSDIYLLQQRLFSSQNQKFTEKDLLKNKKKSADKSEDSKKETEQ